MGKKLYTEAAAAAALVDGNEAGLNFFFELYYTPLIFFSLRVTSDQSASEDIVTEAFLKLWNNRDEIKNPSYIKPYLYRVVHNATIDFLRRQKTRNAGEKELQYLSPSFEGTVLARLIETEFHHQMHLSLKNLPPRMGAVFRMFYLQGKNCHEIAAELKVSVNTVRAQRQRALALLRQDLLLLLVLVCAW